MMRVKVNMMVDRRVYVDVLAMELKGASAFLRLEQSTTSSVRHFGCKAHGNCCRVRPSGPDGDGSLIEIEKCGLTFLRTFLI